MKESERSGRFLTIPKIDLKSLDISNRNADGYLQRLDHAPTDTETQLIRLMYYNEQVLNLNDRNFGSLEQRIEELLTREELLTSINLLPTIGFELEFPSNTDRADDLIGLLTQLGFPRNLHNMDYEYETWEDRSPYLYPNIVEASSHPSINTNIQSEILINLFRSGIVPKLLPSVILQNNFTTQDQISDFISLNVTDQMYAVHINLGLPKIDTSNDIYINSGLLLINTAATLLKTSPSRLRSNQIGKVLNNEKPGSENLTRVELRTYDIIDPEDFNETLKTIHMLTHLLLLKTFQPDEPNAYLWKDFVEESIDIFGLSGLNEIYKLQDLSYLQNLKANPKIHSRLDSQIHLIIDNYGMN